MKALLGRLTESELALVRETERDRMADLDEDALVELHQRVRRARNKYVGQYRRGASARVPVKGGRGAARPYNRAAAEKAEVFEDALSRVSRRLASAARQSADELRSERLEQARAARDEAAAASAAGRAAVGGATPAPGSPADGDDASAEGAASPRTPARRKRDASTLAAGARRQARRDSR